MSEGGESPRNWLTYFPSLFRLGRKNVDLIKVTLGKLVEARKRGVFIDDTTSTGTSATATVNKEVVEGNGPFAPPS